MKKSIQNTKWGAARHIFPLFVLIIGLAAHAQSLQVSGVVSTAGTTVANAAVTFIAVADPSNQVTAITDDFGGYRINLATAVESGETSPATFGLSQNYPNPFSSSTSIPYILERPADALMTIYDIMGREVIRFTLGVQPEGLHGIVWDGKNELGERIPPGTYFCRLQTSEYIQVRKMLYFPGQNAGTDLHSGTIIRTAGGQNYLRKETHQQAATYKVQINNTTNTSPKIMPAEFNDISLENITVKNFYVDKYRPVYAAAIHLDSTRQIIRGFGAANIVGWRPDMTAGQITTAFGTGTGQLGFTVLRLRVPPDSSLFRHQVASAKAAYEKGALIIAAPWTPPAWMKTNHNTVGGRLREDCYAAFAKHLDSFVDYMAANGAPLYAISVQNEPDVSVTYESCDYDGAAMLKFMRGNAPAIGTKVMAPEGYNFNRSLSDPILNDSLATANLGMVCGHLYGDGLTSYPLALAKGKEVWMTEHLVLDTTWVNVLGTGKEIHDCMMANMSAYVWWYIIRYYGPIHENSLVTKRGYVMSQFARFIRPGYHRVDILENPQTGVYLSAYRDGPKVVIVAVNTGTKTVEQSFIMQDGVIAGFTPYVTSISKDCVEGSAISVTGGTFAAIMDALSITTFVSQ